MRSSASRTCCSSCSRTTSRAASRRLGHATDAPHRDRGDVQGRAAADARPPPRAVPALPADRRGVRLPQPRVRGLGGRRRDRDDRDACRRGRSPHVRRLHRPGRVPALHREHLPDDDPARGRGRPRLHARPRRAALRDSPGAGARLHRAQGRHLGQHPGDPGDRRQDGRAARRAVRLARGRDRARGRAVACARQGCPRARRPGTRLEAARDDAARPAARRRSSRARLGTARPLDAEGDLPALRVPRPPRPGRHARRGAACRRAPSLETEEIAWREGAVEELVLLEHKLDLGLAFADGRLAAATGDEVLVARRASRRASSGRRRGEGRGARREAPTPRPGARRRHVDRGVSRRSRVAPATSSTTSPASTAWSSCRCPPPRRRPPRSSGARRQSAVLRRNSRARLREWGSEQLYDEIELPLTAVLADMEDAGIRIDTYRMGEITARLSERVEELEAQALRARRRGVPARLDPAARADPVREARARRPAARARPATRPTPGCCVRSAKITRSCRSSRSGAS